MKQNVIIILVMVFALGVFGGFGYGFTKTCPHDFEREENLCIRKETERAECPENWNMHARTLTCTSGSEEQEVICPSGYEIDYSILGYSSPNCWNCCYRLETENAVTRFHYWFN